LSLSNCQKKKKKKNLSLYNSSAFQAVTQGVKVNTSGDDNSSILSKEKEKYILLIYRTRI